MLYRVILIIASTLLIVFATTSMEAIFDRTEENKKTLSDVTREIAERFPSVSHISIAEVSPLITSRSASKQVLLLDSRTQNEHRVSHIPGAILYSDTLEVKEKIRLASKRGVTIVIYCSVGYRSSELVRRMQAAGLKSVHSLKGGIFEWGNSGLPVINEHKQATHEIHPFSSSWGRYLRPELRSGQK